MLGIDKVLVIYCDYGRLGNRLHTHANALAWCIENNYNLINLSFSGYAELFKSSSKHKSCNLQQTKSFLFKSLSSTLFRNFLFLIKRSLPSTGKSKSQIPESSESEFELLINSRSGTIF